jgi:low temperature requirement protein LtrA
MSGPAHQHESGPISGPPAEPVSAHSSGSGAGGGGGSNNGHQAAPTPSAAERLRRRLTLAPMRPRDTDEPHRASTPLELLFDLCFVVAVSQAARQLNHSLALNHFASGIQGYLLVFFAIWWAWVNFTWFASAYDVDDVPYRILTFVQIVGVLILAAGVPAASAHGDFKVATIGYVVMRVALVTQWVRAAYGDPAGRTVARRYAIGIVVVQVGWVARLFLPHLAGEISFYVLAVADVCVPAFAEWGGRGTAWNARHISERYGLFTLIVLGECVAAATVAMQAATSTGLSAQQVGVAAGGLLLIFALWWWYFEHPSDEGLRMSRNLAFLWGYAHYAVFASIAALGAGLEVALESTDRGSSVSPMTAGGTVAVSVSVYLLVTGIVQYRLQSDNVLRVRFIIPFVVVLLAVGLSARALSVGLALPLMGVIAVALVFLDRREPGFRLRA